MTMTHMENKKLSLTKEAAQQITNWSLFG